VKWIPDRTGTFPKRLYFESMAELDAECERLVKYVHYRKYEQRFEPPLSDDALQVLIETNADVDLYAALPDGVEGVTEFRSVGRPLIKMNESLTADPRRQNRTRTGLAHEWFHAVYHRTAWEMRWARERVTGQRSGPAVCHRDTIVGADDRDWMEFQAGYASCALLMPATYLKSEVDALLEMGVSDQDTLVTRVAHAFLVSEDAARWRLGLLGVLQQLRDRWGLFGRV
jgi:hypothetical protein